jgi:hypothetical protein
MLMNVRICVLFNEIDDIDDESNGGHILVGLVMNAGDIQLGISVSK